MEMTEMERMQLMMDGAMGVLLSLEDDHILSFVLTSWVYVIAQSTGQIVTPTHHLMNMARQFLTEYRESAKAHGVANA